MSASVAHLKGCVALCPTVVAPSQGLVCRGVAPLPTFGWGPTKGSLVPGHSAILPGLAQPTRDRGPVHRPRVAGPVPLRAAQQFVVQDGVWSITSPAKHPVTGEKTTWYATMVVRNRGTERLVQIKSQTDWRPYQGWYLERLDSATGGWTLIGEALTEHGVSHYTGTLSTTSNDTCRTWLINFDDPRFGQVQARATDHRHDDGHLTRTDEMLMGGRWVLLDSLEWKYKLPLPSVESWLTAAATRASGAKAAVLAAVAAWRNLPPEATEAARKNGAQVVRQAVSALQRQGATGTKGPRAIAAALMVNRWHPAYSDSPNMQLGRFTLLPLLTEGVVPATIITQKLTVTYGPGEVSETAEFVVESTAPGVTPYLEGIARLVSSISVLDDSRVEAIPQFLELSPAKHMHDVAGWEAAMHIKAEPRVFAFAQPRRDHMTMIHIDADLLISSFSPHPGKAPWLSIFVAESGRGMEG